MDAFLLRGAPQPSSTTAPTLVRTAEPVTDAWSPAAVYSGPAPAAALERPVCAETSMTKLREAIGALMSEIVTDWSPKASAQSPEYPRARSSKLFLLQQGIVHQGTKVQFTGSNSMVGTFHLARGGESMNFRIGIAGQYNERITWSSKKFFADADMNLRLRVTCDCGGKRRLLANSGREGAEIESWYSAQCAAANSPRSTETESKAIVDFLQKGLRVFGGAWTGLTTRLGLESLTARPESAPPKPALPPRKEYSAPKLDAESLDLDRERYTALVDTIDFAAEVITSTHAALRALRTGTAA